MATDDRGWINAELNHVRRLRPYATAEAVREYNIRCDLTNRELEIVEINDVLRLYPGISVQQAREELGRLYDIKMREVENLPAGVYRDASGWLMRDVPQQPYMQGSEPEQPRIGFWEIAGAIGFGYMAKVFLRHKRGS